MISIIIPAYNAALTLPDCLAALGKQTLSPDEIIVVDDGSLDRTMRAAKENGAQGLQQPHQGPAAARNMGIRQAHGDILLFTDSDCVPTSTWVDEMVRPFEDPLVAGVKGSYKTNQTQVVARLVQCEFEERYDRQERLPFIDFIDSYSAAFRASVLRDLGGFDPAFPQANNEDVELSYRLDKAGCRLVFARQAAVFHTHPATWITYARSKIRRGYWRMMVYRLYPGKALRDSYTPQVLKLQIGLIYLALLLGGLTFAFPIFGWGAGLALTALWLSAIPFFRRAFHSEKGLLLPAVVFITLRALALGAGMVGGLVGMFFFHAATSEIKKAAVHRNG